ncbi:hypothetical protein AMTRI_Chr11g158400 [Amborella trichopoda]
MSFLRLLRSPHSHPKTPFSLLPHRSLSYYSSQQPFHQPPNSDPDPNPNPNPNLDSPRFPSSHQQPPSPPFPNSNPQPPSPPFPNSNPQPPSFSSNNLSNYGQQHQPPYFSANNFPSSQQQHQPPSFSSNNLSNYQQQHQPPYFSADNFPSAQQQHQPPPSFSSDNFRSSQQQHQPHSFSSGNFSSTPQQYQPPSFSSGNFPRSQEQPSFSENQSFPSSNHFPSSTQQSSYFSSNDSQSPQQQQQLQPSFSTLNRLENLIPPSSQQQQPSYYSNTTARPLAISSAEEAAAERRRRKRRLRLEPPLHALRRPPLPHQNSNPNAPRLPDSTSALVGPRLSLHNKVQTLIRSNQLDQATVMARQALFSNTRPTVFTCNAVMAAHLRSRRLSEVPNLFRLFFNPTGPIIPNIVSYNILINSLCDSNEVDRALEMYQFVLANAPFSPSPVTYRHLTKGLTDAGRVPEAMDLLREMLNRGHGADSLVYNTLIETFIKLDQMEKALELFEELAERCLVYDGIVHATLMEGYFGKGDEKLAMDSYNSLLDKGFKMNAATCNSLLKVLLKYGKFKDANGLFEHMLSTHTPPNFLTMNPESYTLFIDYFCSKNKFIEAMEILNRTGVKPCQLDAPTYNNLMSHLSKNGMNSEAERIFKEVMPSKNVNPDESTYELVIGLYFEQGRIDEAMESFAKMVETGLRPNVTMYNNMLDRFMKVSRIDEAESIYRQMRERELKPDGMSYEILLMGLCEGGRLDNCLGLLGEMTRNAVVPSSRVRERVIECFEREGRKEQVERFFFGENGSNAGPNWEGGQSMQAQQVAA